MSRGILTRYAKRAAMIACIATMSLGSLAVPAYCAQTWDLEADFLARNSEADGPIAKDANGDSVWYFKFGPDATNPGTFAALSQWTTSWDVALPPAPAGLKGWQHPSATYPHVAINGTGSEVSYFPGNPIPWPNGRVRVHPGPEPSLYDFTVVEWKSPVEGDATISIVLQDADPKEGNNGFRYWVLKNGTVLETNPVAEAGSATINSEQAVLEGDSVYVVVGPNGTGSTAYYYDSTFVDFEVAVDTPPVVSTPASSGWTLGLLAVLGLAALPIVRHNRVEARA